MIETLIKLLEIKMVANNFFGEFNSEFIFW